MGTFMSNWSPDVRVVVVQPVDTVNGWPPPVGAQGVSVMVAFWVPES